MGVALRIDFVSDVVCPWCVIGLKSLQQALDAIGDEVEAEIHFQPFELNPDMPPEGENIAEHVRRKYGAQPEKSAASRRAIIESGGRLGFEFNYGPDSRIWNTFAAHRLLYWAGVEGRQFELKQALFRATFTDHSPISDHDVLVATAASAGLDAGKARQVLDTGAFAAEVRREQAAWVGKGIRAVPSIIFNGRWMIQGGQAPQVFERAIRDIVSGVATQAVS
jgi:predicted DsbA family dithiol-disulfide isomerase